MSSHQTPDESQLRHGCHRRMTRKSTILTDLAPGGIVVLSRAYRRAIVTLRRPPIRLVRFVTAVAPSFLRAATIMARAAPLEAQVVDVWDTRQPLNSLRTEVEAQGFWGGCTSSARSPGAQEDPASARRTTLRPTLGRHWRRCRST